MEKNFSRIKISDGINFNIINDNRFKTDRISVTMFLPLEKETASAYATLPYVLSNSCRKYPDFTSLNRRLAELYGASLSADVMKMGDMQGLSVGVSFLDDDYALFKENLSAELTQLLCDVLFDPLLENGTFKKQNVEQEKRQIVEAIDAEFNDKKTLAMMRCVELMCKDEKFGINRFGRKEDVVALTPDDIFKAWKKVMKTARIEIMALGKINSDSAIEVFKNAFSKIERENIVSFESKVVREAKSVKDQRDTLDISQSKLVMGFRTGVALEDPDVMATRVAVALYGATPQSKLFLNVREKLSLCYYCSSSYNRNKGIMFVQSGVETKNIEKAKAEILNQLEQVKKGNFTDDELNDIKRRLASSYRTVKDMLGGLSAFYLGQVFYEKFSSPEQYVEDMYKITKDQVIEAAKKITLDTAYALVGNNNSK